MAMLQNTDVAIVGAGIFGLCCAWHCHKAGLSVAVFDQAGIGQGASGGVVGAMAPHVPELWNPKKQFQLEALISASDFWREVDQISGACSGFGRIGRVIPIAGENAFTIAKNRQCQAAKLWPEGFDWTVGTDIPELLSKRAAPFGVVHDTLAARINPAAACSSLHRGLVRFGVKFFPGHKISNLHPYKVAGEFGECHAQAIILAAGLGGFDLLTPHFGFATGSGVKGQAAVLALAMPDHPQIFADGIYIVPHKNGTVAVGSTSENAWSDGQRPDGKLDEVLVKATQLCPQLAQAKIIGRWAGVRPKALKRDPMLGPVPGLGGVFSALGAFKIGFGIAHEVGSVLSDLVQGAPRHLPDSFTVKYHLGGQ